MDITKITEPDADDLQAIEAMVDLENVTLAENDSTSTETWLSLRCEDKDSFVLPNEVANGIMNYGTHALNIMAYLAAQEMQQIDDEEGREYFYRLTYAEIKSICKIKNSARKLSYTTLKVKTMTPDQLAMNAVAELRARSMKVVLKVDKATKARQIYDGGLLTYFLHNPEGKYVDCAIAKPLLPLWRRLSTYVRSEFPIFQKLNSSYAKRIYVLLLEWRNKRDAWSHYFSVAWLREHFSIEKEYERSYDIKKYVIDLSIAEISKISPFTVTSNTEYGKSKGKPIIGFTLTCEMKEKKKKAVVASNGLEKKKTMTHAELVKKYKEWAKVNPEHELNKRIQYLFDAHRNVSARKGIKIGDFDGQDLVENAELMSACSYFDLELRRMLEND